MKCALIGTSKILLYAVNQALKKNYTSILH